MTPSDESLLQHSHRVIRRLTGSDSPWPALLVQVASGETRLLVDCELLGTAWRGWTADEGGHVLAPLDLIRRRDGHDVVLPVCSETIEDFLHRRAAAGADLTEGEALTLAVSALRGCAELEKDPQTGGTWWLTDAGRPVFATDAAAQPITITTVELLEQLATIAPRLAAPIADGVAAVQDSRGIARELDRVESSLFALAEPEPLATTVLGPRVVRTVVEPTHAPQGIDEGAGERATWWNAIGRHLDAEWADLVARLSTSIWRRLRSRPRGGRRRPWVVAGGLASAVVVVGVMWPTGGAGPATADLALPSPSPSATAASDPAPAAGSDSDAEAGTGEPITPEPAGSDLAVVVSALLSARTACGDDMECLAATMEDPAKTFPAGAIDLPGADRTATLVDDFGGIAVLRIDGPSATVSQLAVIVRIDDAWRLRDVHDVAEP